MLFLTQGSLAYVPAPTDNWIEEINPDYSRTNGFDLEATRPLLGNEFPYRYEPLPSSIQTVDEAVDAIIKQMNNFGIVGEYDKALYLHDWLVMNANYDYSYTYIMKMECFFSTRGCVTVMPWLTICCWITRELTMYLLVHLR